MRGLRVGRAGWLLAVLLMAPLTGCGNPDTSPIPTGLPSTHGSTPAVSASPPAPSGRWKALSAKCPTLTSEAARGLNVAGEGSPGPQYTDARLTLSAPCAWGAVRDGGRPGVDVSVQIYRVGIDKGVEQQAADAFREAEDKVRSKAAGEFQRKETLLQDEPGLGNQAFSVLYPASEVMSLTVRSDNAIVSVRIVLQHSPETDLGRLTGQLQRQQPAIRELAKDVLDDLR